MSNISKLEPFAYAGFVLFPYKYLMCEHKNANIFLVYTMILDNCTVQAIKYSNNELQALIKARLTHSVDSKKYSKHKYLFKFLVMSVWKSL